MFQGINMLWGIHVDNFTQYIPLYNKEADLVAHTYIFYIYSVIGRWDNILSHNGTEFKNKLFTQAASTLRMKHISSSSYYLQGNGCIENLHNFPKTCIWKQVFSELAWDKVTHIAPCKFKNKLFTQAASTLRMKHISSSSYYLQGSGCIDNLHNFPRTRIWKQVFSELAWDKVTHIAPCSWHVCLKWTSKENTFFLMFRIDACMQLEHFLSPKVRYMGNEKIILALDGLRYIYALAISNINCLKTEKRTSFWHILYWNFLLKTKNCLEIT